MPACYRPATPTTTVRPLLLPLLWRSAIRKLIITLPGVCQTEHSVCQGGRKTRFGASRSSIQPSKQPIWDFEPLIFCWLKIFVLVKLHNTNFETNCTKAICLDFLQKVISQKGILSRSSQTDLLVAELENMRVQSLAIPNKLPGYQIFRKQINAISYLPSKHVLKVKHSGLRRGPLGIFVGSKLN